MVEPVVFQDCPIRNEKINFETGEFWTSNELVASFL